MKMSLFYQSNVKNVLKYSKIDVNKYTVIIICVYGINLWITL